MALKYSGAGAQQGLVGPNFTIGRQELDIVRESLPKVSDDGLPLVNDLDWRWTQSRWCGLTHGAVVTLVLI